MLLDGGANDLGRDREERFVEGAHQGNRPFDQAGDLIEELGVFHQVIALGEGKVSGVGKNDLLAPLVEKKPHRSIFLDRRSRYGRQVSNKPELELILDKHGFETIFAEDLPYAGQIKLLSEVKNIVGIHGAGLTNLLFSDVPSVRCLEILPEGYVNPHYYWMLQMTGAQRYDAIVGSELDSNTNFTVDAGAFETQVDLLLA